MSRSLLVLVAAAVLALMGLAGCGRGPREIAVSGTVSLDTVPLADGVIRFSPVDGSTTTQAAKIKDGKFQAQLHETTYRVEISSMRATKNPRKTDPTEPGGNDPTFEELVPPRYNKQSDLTLDVKEARSDLRYDLESR